jgi:hypothetical protein
LAVTRGFDRFSDILFVGLSRRCPHSRCGGVLGVVDDGHRWVPVLPGRAFWGEDGMVHVYPL